MVTDVELLNCDDLVVAGAGAGAVFSKYVFTLMIATGAVPYYQ
ncbi:MAG: hypothetical protein R2794_07675 [Chitinophagales bacterium]